jgi:hypothetical protein
MLNTVVHKITTGQRVNHQATKTWEVVYSNKQKHIFNHGTMLRSAFQVILWLLHPLEKDLSTPTGQQNRQSPEQSWMLSQTAKFVPKATSSVQLVTLQDISTFKLLNIHKN